MVNYQNGKIYKLWSPQTDKIYIGSTTKLLCQRLGCHKGSYKKYLNGIGHNITSFKLLEYPDCSIELIENYPCNSREELNKREGELIRQYKEVCVNRCIAGRTTQEYYDEYKERYLEYQKGYYNEHKERYQQYRDEHKDYFKEYRDTHKSYFKSYRKEYDQKKYTCECGVVLTLGGKSKHIKSKKHQKYLQQASTEEQQESPTYDLQ